MTIQERCCWHCGEPLQAGVGIRALVAGQPRPMCCQGCRAAAEWIEHLGLADYYRLRTTPSQTLSDVTTPGNSGDDDWNDAESSRHVIRELGAGLRESLLLIEGMHCTACVWLIERALGAMKGIVSIQVNAVARRARVVWRDSEITLPQILQALPRIGFHALPLDAQGLDDARRHESRAALKRLLVAGFGAMQAMMFAPALLSWRGRFTRRVHSRFASLGGLPGSDTRCPLFGAAILRRRHALAQTRPARDGRPGCLRHSGRLRRKLHRGTAGQRRGLLRFDLDVRVLPACRSLSRNACAASRRRSHRCVGQTDSALCRPTTRGRHAATDRDPRAACWRLRSCQRRRHRASRWRVVERAL